MYSVVPIFPSVSMLVSAPNAMHGAKHPKNMSNAADTVFMDKPSVQSDA